MSIPALNTAIYSRLAGTYTSAGTKVYYLQAPDNAALPYIVFDYVASRDENMTQNRTKDCSMFIRAYGTTPGQAGTIDGQIDGRLHNVTLTVSGYTNFWTMRENAYSLSEVDASGRKTFMAGADYRVRLDVT
jgi:hypothetical protein